MRVGIDVGGTNTDAVLLDGRRVLAEAKAPTTADVTGGISSALRGLVAADAASLRDVQAVMIGTTQFTNAVIEAKGLLPTAVVRLGLPATQALPPMADWPQRLRQVVCGQIYLCHGGHEFDGRELSSLDAGELQRVAADIAAKGLRSIAICSVFSPVNAECEQQAAQILAAALPGVTISLSHEIGRVGLLERENATIINACLRDLAVRIVDGLRTALARFEISAPVHLSQNDGTLMSVEAAERYPVATFACGPTNSMRGAAFLSGLPDCAVVDIGGTTTDVGMLHHGFPRQASVAVDIGGVRTNFRMPDVWSLGLGGGSMVRQQPELTIGPDSVGYELTTRALVFGGDTVTATDLAVAGGLATIGDPERVAGLDPRLIGRGLQRIEQTVAGAVDRMKTTAEPVPVVVVGGGSVLLGEDLPGASVLIKPDHCGVANAIGAAIAQVGGETDRVLSLQQRSRAQVLEQAMQEAIDKAVAAGAVPGKVQVVEVEEVPLTYLPGNATRIRVKAVGDLDLEGKTDAAYR
ncbi:MAG: hydantoinase/oxoprolinase family protein [Actinomycetota bacterium]|nr:hydantoinase/oxoprolinase family protein [Actinomycetota bacterium]